MELVVILAIAYAVIGIIILVQDYFNDIDVAEAMVGLTVGMFVFAMYALCWPWVAYVMYKEAKETAREEATRRPVKSNE